MALALASGAAAAKPTVGASAPATVTLGEYVTLTGEMHGAVETRGTVTFNVYGPGDPTCASAPIWSLPFGTGHETVLRWSMQTTAIGTYEFVVEYSGDGQDEPASTGCGAASFEVLKRPQAISLPAITHVTLGEPDFTVGAAATSGLAVTYSSLTTSVCTIIAGKVHLASAGECEIEVEQPGDAEWSAAAPAEISFEVDEAVPGISSDASGPIALGGALADTATLSGGHSPGGAVTFSAYGPDDPTCSGPPVWTSSPVPVTGEGTYASPSFIPASPGTYVMVAGYSGDSGNQGVVSDCEEATASAVVAKAASDTALGVDPGSAVLGGAVTLIATVTGHSPTGTVTFTDGQATLGTAPIDADGMAEMRATALPAGTHALVASYGGDSGNLPSTSSTVVETTAVPAQEGSTPAAAGPDVFIAYDPNHPHRRHRGASPHWTFAFFDPAPGSTFFCRLDVSPFSPCGSPTVYRQLSRGRHVFRVMSVSASGQESPVRKVVFRVGAKHPRR